jgi:hypothetical protein
MGIITANEAKNTAGSIAPRKPDVDNLPVRERTVEKPSIVKPTEAIWLTETIEEIRNLTLSDDWVQDGIEASSQWSRDQAISFLRILSELESQGQNGTCLKPDRICPCVEGGVTFLWSRSRKREIDMSFFNSEESLLCYMDEKMQPAITAVDEDRLTEAANRIYTWLHDEM